MTAKQRRWLIVLVMWLCATFIHGTGSVMGSVFFAPLLKHFGGSRTRIAALTTVNVATAAVLLPFSGWLLDMFEARWVICGGSLLTMLGFIVASHANAFSTLVFANFLMGAGIAGAGLIAASVVISNWFKEQRGLALGLVATGVSFGVGLIAPLATSMIGKFGWRFAYLVLAIPPLVLVIPLVLAIVTSRPEGASNRSRSDSSLLAGLELREALKGHTLWLLLVANFVSYMLVSSTYVHEISFLTGLGYTPVHATLALTAQWTVAGFGKPMSGVIADRVDVRRTLAVAWLACGWSTLFLLKAVHPGAVALYALFYGLVSGAPVTLMPLLIADCFGLKRFGTLSGILNFSGMVGASLGPLLAGRVFDMYKSYNPFFVLLAILATLNAVVPFLCARLEERAAAPELVPAQASTVQRM
jgi:MFS family permease